MKVTLALLLMSFSFFAYWQIFAESNNDSQKSEKVMDELKNKLTPLQYKVTQECGTEPPFNNEYWDNHEAGIYVDIVSGEPLFSSLDKFDSGSGWPSFTKPISESFVKNKVDNSHGMQRIEVRSSKADSHLGHVFDDGPGPDGKRFCINSASLRFIPVKKLAEEGYENYLSLFDSTLDSEKIQTSSLQTEKAILAGGCFWGMEEIIRSLPGVSKTRVGYTGGKSENPSYALVSSGRSGHAEAVEVEFNSAVITFEELLGVFFRMHDPTTKNRQGNDIGTQYRSAIFFTSDEQKAIAEKVIEQVNSSKKWDAPIVTELVKASEFYPAEEYHQDYLQKNPGGYTCHYLRD